MPCSSWTTASPSAISPRSPSAGAFTGRLSRSARGPKISSSATSTRRSAGKENPRFSEPVSTDTGGPLVSNRSAETSAPVERAEIDA